MIATLCKKKFIRFFISQSRQNNWAMCPDAYFLQGLYRSNGTELQSIEQALCCRPRNFESVSLDCNDHNVKISIAEDGWSTCPDRSYMVGMYRKTCNELDCIEMFKCCMMPPPGTQLFIPFIHSFMHNNIQFIICNCIFLHDDKI